MPSNRRSLLGKFILIVFLAVFALSIPFAHAADSTNMKLLTPEELVKILGDRSTKTAKPLLLQVGSQMLYAQAHIPGSAYMGQGNSARGLQNLDRRVSNLPKKTFIVLYCGCCPWSHCPNVNPAYDALQKLGFTDVKVLYIANNFGADWVDKGYPVAKGEK